MRNPKITIFAVDDEILHLQQYERRFVDILGMAFVGCASFDEAQEKLRSGRLLQTPLLAILDHNLESEETGFDVCRLLRTEHAFGELLPIYYLSGKASQEDFDLEVERTRDQFLQPTRFLRKGEGMAWLELIGKTIDELSRFISSAASGFQNEVVESGLQLDELIIDD